MPPFMGKLSNMTITGWHSDSPEAPEPLALAATYKSLKYRMYCVTVDFRTVDVPVAIEPALSA